MRSNILLFISLFAIVSSCRDDVVKINEEHFNGTAIDSLSLSRLYLLNEGNMGSNKASLDAFDFMSGTYTRSYWKFQNPTSSQSLGDVGNDIIRYGSHLWLAINCSNLIEITDLDAHHVSSVEVPNCRFLASHDGYVYCTSYAGPVSFEIDKAQYGLVYKIDTLNYSVVATCQVGYQPDGIAILNDTIYVANSGGYLGASSADLYENTISVIPISSFSVSETISVAPNLNLIQSHDPSQSLFVNSRGDYAGSPSALYHITKNNSTYDIQLVAEHCSNFSVSDSLVFIINSDSKSSCQVYDIYQKKSDTVSLPFNMQCPYGICKLPHTDIVCLTDAKDYVSPGTLYMYNYKSREIINTFITGDIPAHFCLVY